MAYAKDIKEEEKGHEHYERMAKTHPKFKKTFKRMAEDEEGHEEKLKKMAKAKALKKRTK